MPKVSICVPIHNMYNGDKFLWQLVNSLLDQTFKDWELIITRDGKMAENTNSAIKKARGELIKILYLDDRFSSENSLFEMVAMFEDPNCNWLISGADDNRHPHWTSDIEKGNNHLGSPSALMFRNESPLLFDENLSWLLDCDLYRRMFDRYGQPVILLGNHITIGKGEHQMTNILTNEEKLSEYDYLNKKHE